MAEGKKKQKKSPWWYKLGSLVFGAVFCVSAVMAGRDYLAAKKEAAQMKTHLYVSLFFAAILMVLAFLINLSASLVSKYYGRKNRIG